MRIAALILSLFVSGITAVQSLSVFFLSSVASNLGSEQAETDIGSSSIGILVSFLTLVALAFVWGYPTFSMVLYVVAALFAFMAGTLGFGDMNVWGSFLLVLAVLAFFGRREKRKKNALQTSQA